MVVSIAPWSLVVRPGKKISYDVIRDIKVTNAALGAKLEDEKARSTLKVTYELPAPLSHSEEEGDSPEKSRKKNAQKAEISLCSLIPSSIEQASLNITFTEDDLVEFEVVGKNSIHLFGSYVDQAPLQNDLPPDFGESDEESVDLRDVSSDVEIDLDELAGLDDSDDDERFEEIEEGISSAKKRPHDSDAMDQDASAKVSSSATKANKRLKGEDGAPVSPSVTQTSKTDAKPESKKDKKKKKNKKEGKEGKEDTEEKKGDAEGAEGGDAKPSKLPLKELGGGLKFKDVKVGTGKQAKAGNTVFMRYIGKLTDGKVFDSNTKGKPFTFRLGSGDVIKGWDQGVAGMQVGGERLLIVPPAFAYGKKPPAGIPPNATLRFELKLIDIK